MDSSKIRRKKPAQIPSWQNRKYDRYDLRFLQRGREERLAKQYDDPTAREIWKALISDEKEPPPPKKPTWRVGVALLWLAVVRRLVSEDADEVRSWLEEKGDGVRVWLEELPAAMATAVSSLM